MTVECFDKHLAREHLDSHRLGDFSRRAPEYVPAADNHEDVGPPRFNPAPRGDQRQDSTCQVAAASVDHFGMHSVAVTPKKGGDGGPNPLAHLPAFVLKTCEILVAARGNGLAGGF